MAFKKFALVFVVCAPVVFALLLWIGLPRNTKKESKSPEDEKVAGGVRKIEGFPKSNTSESDIFKELMRKLDSDDPKERLDAVQGLGEMGVRGRGAIHKLVPLWKKQDELGRAIERALERIGPPDGKSDFELIVDRLKDDNQSIRKYAAGIIKKMGRGIPEDAIPRTIDALNQILSESKDSDISVRQAAVLVLPLIGKGHYRGKVLTPLLIAVDDEDLVVSGKAREGLVSLEIDGDKDLDVIKRALNHNQGKRLLKPAGWDLRLFSVELLAKGNLNDEAAEVLCDAAKAPIGAIRAGDDAKVYNSRELAIMALAKVKNADLAFPVLIGIVNAEDEKKEILAVTLASLEKLGNPPASQKVAILRCLKHKQIAARRYAITTLSKINELRDTDVNRLAECLNDGEKDVACVTATTLGKLAKAAKASSRQLQDVVDNKEADKDLRRKAIWALGEIGRSDESVYVLKNALDDQDVRNHAAEAWAKIADKTDIVHLRRLVSKEELGPAARVQLIKTLGELHPKGKELVEVSLDLQRIVKKKDANKEVRRQAVSALGEIGRTDGAATTVFVALVSDPELGDAALETLEKIAVCDKNDVDLLGELLNAKHLPDVRSFAAKKLGAMKGDFGKGKPHPAVKFLKNSLEKEELTDVQLDLIRALGALGPDAKSAASTLVNCLVKIQSENQDRKKVTAASNQYLLAQQFFLQESMKVFSNNKDTARRSMNDAERNLALVTETVAKAEFENVREIIEAISAVGDTAWLLTMSQKNGNPFVRAAAQRAYLKNKK